MGDYSEMVERYNGLVRKHNTHVLLLKDYSRNNGILREELARLKNERDELEKRAKALERNLINILVHLSQGRSNTKELLRCLGSMALTDKDGTICMTSLRFSKEAMDFARERGVTLVEEPRGCLEEGPLEPYQNL